MVYTIGIKRKFLPGYKKFHVTMHKTQFNVAGVPLPHPRLVLTLVNGDEVAIGAIDLRDFIVYADFKAENARLHRQQQEETEKQLYQEFLTIKAKAANQPIEVQAPAPVQIPKPAEQA